MRAGGAIVKTEGMRLAAPVQSDESGKAARRFRSLHRVVVVVCFHLVVLAFGLRGARTARRVKVEDYIKDTGGRRLR